MALLAEETVKRLLSAAVLIPLVLCTAWWGGVPWALLLAALAGLAFLEWVRISRGHPAWALAGLAVCAATAVALYMVRAVQGVPAVFFLLCLVWLTDTAAYAVGRKYGRRKLWSAVSPGKTWEGAIGALVLAPLLTAAVFSSYGMAVALCIVAQAGDLLESAFKRRFGVKDSGRFLPGHGGVLDRTDSFLLTVPGYILLNFDMYFL